MESAGIVTFEKNGPEEDGKYDPIIVMFCLYAVIFS